MFVNPKKTALLNGKNVDKLFATMLLSVAAKVFEAVKSFRPLRIVAAGCVKVASSPVMPSEGVWVVTVKSSSPSKLKKLLVSELPPNETDPCVDEINWRASLLVLVLNVPNSVMPLLVTLI